MHVHPSINELVYERSKINDLTYKMIDDDDPLQGSKEVEKGNRKEKQKREKRKGRRAHVIKGLNQRNHVHYVTIHTWRAMYACMHGTHVKTQSVIHRIICHY